MDEIGFYIKKGYRVLIIEDVITTGKSSMECVKLIVKSKGILVGFASIIDRSTKKNLKIKKKVVSHMKIDVPTYKKKQLPDYLKSMPITIPGYYRSSWGEEFILGNIGGGIGETWTGIFYVKWYECGVPIVV